MTFQWTPGVTGLNNSNLNVHALFMVPFATAAAVCHKISITWLNIIMKIGFPINTMYIKKQRNRSKVIKSFIGLCKQTSNGSCIIVISNDEYSPFLHLKFKLHK